MGERIGARHAKLPLGGLLRSSVQSAVALSVGRPHCLQANPTELDSIKKSNCQLMAKYCMYW